MDGALVMVPVSAEVEVGVLEEASVAGAALAGVTIGAEISQGGEEVMRQDITCLIP
jgi:hypothetical protein